MPTPSKVTISQDERLFILRSATTARNSIWRLMAEAIGKGPYSSAQDDVDRHDTSISEYTKEAAMLSSLIEKFEKNSAWTRGVHY